MNSKIGNNMTNIYLKDLIPHTAWSVTIIAPSIDPNIQQTDRQRNTVFLEKYIGYFRFK